VTPYSAQVQYGGENYDPSYARVFNDLADFEDSLVSALFLRTAGTYDETATGDLNGDGVNDPAVALQVCVFRKNLAGSPPDLKYQ